MNLLYRQHILDHYKNPQNWGKLNCPPAKIVKAKNISCGDSLELYIETTNTNGKIIIKDVKFNAVACSVCISSSSMLLENAIGLELENFLNTTKEEILENFFEELTENRKKCALLIYSAIQEYKKEINNV